MKETEYDIEDEPDFYGDLKEAAWNILHENPGIGFNDWRLAILEQYPAEVVDALGTDPEEVFATFADMWSSEEYEDLQTGECHTLAQWAEYFATGQSLERYDILARAHNETRHLNAFSRPLKREIDILSSEATNAVRIQINGLLGHVSSQDKNADSRRRRFNNCSEK